MGAANADPPLTVAIPTCNGAAHVADALRSILNQEGVNFELVVSDDCSDDDTLDVVRAAAKNRARIERNSQRLGLAGNWNRCIARSHTPLVAIFHQDDLMLPGHLAAHLAAFRSDESIGLVASASEVIDERGQPVAPSVVERGGLGPVDRIYEAGQLAAEMTGGNPLRCSAVTIRCAACADTGGFDPSYQYVLDWDFWLRVSRRWQVAWLSRASVAVRWHPASETQRFTTGTLDLDETARLLDQLFSVDLKDRADHDCLLRAANSRLGRAFLNRALLALHAGSHELAGDCLRRAVRRSPGLIKAILADPRLCVQMGALAVAPRLAGRFFGGRGPAAGL